MKSTSPSADPVVANSPISNNSPISRPSSVQAPKPKTSVTPISSKSKSSKATKTKSTTGPHGRKITSPLTSDLKTPKIKRLTASARREIELKNHARKLAGLSLITVKVRRCIVCKKQFESSGNRICGCQSRRTGFIAGREII